MRIKVKPEDFTVRERSRLSLADAPAAFRVYELSKRQWDTLDLIDFLAHRFSIPRTDIAVSGMKDRYGDTRQLISVKNRPGLPAALEEKNFTLRHKGYTDEKLKAAHIDANEFAVVIRDIPHYQVDVILKNCREAGEQGFPNYYDEQRFGSARAGAGFMGKALFLDDMEEALKIYFSPSAADRRDEKDFKKAIIEHWRCWAGVGVKPPHKHARVFDALVAFNQGEAFIKAVNAIDRGRLIMALNGYQSFLFNRIVARFLEGMKTADGCIALERLAFKYGDLFFYRVLTGSVFQRLSALELPVPGHDTVAMDPDVDAALQEVLAGEKITLADLTVKKLPVKTVRGVWRALITRPADFSVSGPAQDEVYPGRYKLRLTFALQRGAYATMLVKRISLGTR